MSCDREVKGINPIKLLEKIKQNKVIIKRKYFSPFVPIKSKTNCEIVS